ncbi:hypothetical protein [Mesorhizobium sp. M0037]|uniref:hypothetical protein n=1 Tax=unclassified Mesorhizobium TaxID=325217 RepID=UPI00333879E9
MQQHATLAATMLANPDCWGTPVPVSDEQADADLAAWQLGRTVRMICGADCADGSCLEDPQRTYDDLLDIIPDLPAEGTMRAQAAVLVRMCLMLIRERATGARA